MPMKPGKDETQSEFMSRCIPEMIGTGDDKRPQEQAVAICMDIWRNSKKGAAMNVHHKRFARRQCDPADYDDDERDQFMSDCQDEGTDEDTCAMQWEDRSAKEV